tara:strand:+ start:8393 stop:8725 length:333 start_codon:yes stop_codon:yes gene_type:complete
MVKKRKKTKKLKKKKKSRRSRLSTYDYEQEEKRQLEEYLDNRRGGKEGVPPVIFGIPALIFGLITYGMWQIELKYGVWTLIISYGLMYYIIKSYLTDRHGRTHWDQRPRN